MGCGPSAPADQQQQTPSKQQQRTSGPHQQQGSSNGAAAAALGSSSSFSSVIELGSTASNGRPPRQPPDGRHSRRTPAAAGNRGGSASTAAPSNAWELGRDSGASDAGPTGGAGSGKSSRRSPYHAHPGGSSIGSGGRNSSGHRRDDTSMAVGVPEDLGQSWQRPWGPSMPLSWRKGDSVGSGSFGHVYLGLNNDTGELLAIKEVSLMDDSGSTQRKEAVAQLEHEVALLSGLDHPNIVRYVGTLRESTNLLIFLEYVPGGSISSLLSRFGALKESVICIYARQLLSGLAYLHAQRTVHRDVKGANLLVETNGRVKLADFGMAKQMVEEASFTKSFKGSAFWMAPEVIRQQGHGMAADIWSLGCTVLEMATGKPPWSQCATQVQAIFKIASSQDLPAIPDSLSPQATEFVLLCLQRDPSARPSAESLLNHPFVSLVDTTAVPALRSMDYRYLSNNPAGAASLKAAASGGSSSSHLGAGSGGTTSSSSPMQHHKRGAPHGQWGAAGGAGHRATAYAAGLKALNGAAGAAAFAKPAAQAPAKAQQLLPPSGREPAPAMLAAAVTADSLIEQVLGKAGTGQTSSRAAPAQAPTTKQQGPGASSQAADPVDTSVQPANFKVRGLLSLSQLPLLAQESLPVIHVSQLYVNRPGSGSPGSPFI